MPSTALGPNGEVVSASDYTRDNLILQGPFRCTDQKCGVGLVVCGGQVGGKILHFRHLACHQHNGNGAANSGGESDVHRGVKAWIADNISSFSVIESECPLCATPKLRTFENCVATCEGCVPGLPYRFDVLLHVRGGGDSAWQAVEVVHTHGVCAEKLRAVHNAYPLANGSRILQVKASDFISADGITVQGAARVREKYCYHAPCAKCVVKELPAKRPRHDTCCYLMEEPPIIDSVGLDSERLEAVEISRQIIDKVTSYAGLPPSIDGTLIRVTAVAGAGKTTLLKEYIRALPGGCKALVLMFNREPRDEMQDFVGSIGMGGNVHVRTIHQFLGCPPVETNFKISCIAAKNEHKVYRGVCGWCSRQIQTGLKRFAFTLHAKPGHEHCKAEFVNKKTPAGVVDVGMRRQWDVLRREMASGNVKVDIAFMSRYLYEKPDKVFSMLSEYSHIVIDEAQDLSQVEATLFATKIVGKTTLVVGDPLQCINQFRGADVNVMGSIIADKDKDFILPCTYRYGFPLNRFVEKVVRTCGAAYGNTYQEFRAVSGSGTGTDVIQVSDLFSIIPQLTVSRETIHCIFRTNPSILMHILKLVEKDAAVNICVDKRFDEYLLKDELFLSDLCRLSLGQPTTHSKFKYFTGAEGFNKFRGGCKAREETDKLILCNFIEGRGSEVLALLPKILQKVQQINKDFPTLHFHTTHGAKGATFETVFVGDDFATGTREELNILYVALTRAHAKCFVSDTTFDLAFEAKSTSTVWASGSQF